MFIGPKFEIENPADFKNCLKLFLFSIYKPNMTIKFGVNKLIKEEERSKFLKRTSAQIVFEQ